MRVGRLILAEMVGNIVIVLKTWKGSTHHECDLTFDCITFSLKKNGNWQKGKISFAILDNITCLLVTKAVTNFSERQGKHISELYWIPCCHIWLLIYSYSYIICNKKLWPFFIGMCECAWEGTHRGHHKIKDDHWFSWQYAERQNSHFSKVQ